MDAFYFPALFVLVICCYVCWFEKIWLSSGFPHSTSRYQLPHQSRCLLFASSPSTYPATAKTNLKPASTASINMSQGMKLVFCVIYFFLEKFHQTPILSCFRILPQAFFSSSHKSLKMIMAKKKWFSAKFPDLSVTTVHGSSVWTTVIYWLRHMGPQMSPVVSTTLLFMFPRLSLSPSGNCERRVYAGWGSCNFLCSSGLTLTLLRPMILLFMGCYAWKVRVMLCCRCLLLPDGKLWSELKLSCWSQEQQHNSVWAILPPCSFWYLEGIEGEIVTSQIVMWV